MQTAPTQLCPFGQTIPQPPQLVLVVGARHVPPQFTCDMSEQGVVTVHAGVVEVTHDAPAAHALVHEPQCPGLLSVLVHCPPQH
jgi:hypothetical protein